MHLTRFRAYFIKFCNYLWINAFFFFSKFGLDFRFFATAASNLTLIFIGFWRFLFDYEKKSYRARIRFLCAQKAKYIWFL